MIINIRGTSGSGKTYAVKKFLEEYAPDIQILGDFHDKSKVLAHCVYVDMVPVYFIGSYKNVCGGCDSIPSQDMVCSLVRHFARFGHVVFEGLIMSHLYARYKALYQEMSGLGEPFIFAFMDTPLDVCLKRIEQRRHAKGNDKPLNPENTIGKFDSTLKVMDRFVNDGFHVRVFNYNKNPVPQILEMLQYDDFSFVYKEESFR